MSLPIIPLGSYGQSIRCTVTDNGTAVDISSATNLKIIFRTPAPDSQTIEKDASLISGGTTGILGWTVTDGFFDAKNKRLLGTWSFQPSLTLGGWSGTTNDKHQFKVVDRLQKP